jgi:hypothetical protein
VAIDEALFERLKPLKIDFNRLLNSPALVGGKLTS